MSGFQCFAGIDVVHVNLQLCETPKNVTDVFEAGKNYVLPVIGSIRVSVVSLWVVASSSVPRSCSEKNHYQQN